jgi:hypothetical protein
MAQAQPDQLHAAVDEGRVGTNQDRFKSAPIRFFIALGSVVL